MEQRIFLTASPTASRKLFIGKTYAYASAVSLLTKSRNSRIDTLTWLSGSMIRRIMSSVCRQALEHGGELTCSGGISLLVHLLIKTITGSGCTKLWRGIVKRTFADQSTFESMTRELRRSFKGHAEALQQELGDLVSTQLGAIRATLDIVREGNAAEESERHPELRQRVAGEVERARNLMGI